VKLTDRLQQFGYRLPRLRRSVWLSGTAPDIAAAYPIVDQALRQRPGYGLVLIVPMQSLGDLRQLYPHELVLPTPRPGAVNRWREALDPVLQLDAANSLKADDIVRELPPLAAGATASDVIPTFVTRLAGPPVADVDELKRRLSSPKIILCLGNGPTSEDPRLADMAHDALFRVNWIWRARGFLTEPDMVFTADPDLPTGKKRPIVIFPNREAGLPILSGYCRRLSPPRRGYGFFSDLLPDPLQGRLPTNGALMIAVAAALEPRRLIIAGMDLYAHETGRYPGDDKAVDGYSRQHDRQSDVALIRKVLAGCSGETVIIGEQLRAALEHRTFS
jgi:hypothetical protein